MPNPPSSGLPNPAHYTDNGDATVRDDVTGLLWQQAVAPEPMVWTEALAYCDALRLADVSWRLPTRIEMMSLVDFTRVFPAIDVVAFPDTPSERYFTASPWILSVTDPTRPQYAWTFTFYEGLTSNAGDQGIPYYVRCVSGGGDGELPADPPPNLYREVALGEIQDNYTGLIWQQGGSPSQMSWAEAMGYCATLGLNGQVWRLPSIKELATLVDETRVYGALNTEVFPDTVPNEWYMSSSEWAGNASTSSSGAWAINYDDGFTDSGYSNHFTTGWVRCVR